MRWLALSGLCGCSLIYNPNNLPSKPPVDAMPDAEIIFDADPTMLMLADVSPAVIYEGQGDQSRPAVITISGHHIVKNSTSVAITVHAGQSKTATITVDNTQLDVAADGDMVAVPVKLPVDMNLGTADMLALDVALTQDTPTGPITKMISGKLSLQGLPELKDGDNTSLAPTDSAPQFTHSRVMLTGPITAANNTAPVFIRATSTVAIGGTINFNANPNNNSVTVPGPAGGTGGAGGGTVVGSQGGSPGGGPGGGAANTGGHWAGNEQLTTLAIPNRSGGGGGGDGAALGAGGDGGGGGGSIEVTAGGDLSVGTIHANGATGGSPGLNAKSGAGGSGGAILLRSANGKVMVNGAVTVDPGGGTGAAAGAPGRIRIDAPTTITGAPATYFRGPTFASTTPLIVRQESPMLTITAQGGRNVQYYTSKADGTDTHGPVTMLMPTNGTTTFTMQIQLFRGSNRLCAMVEGGNASTFESDNCITISYLYTP